MNRKPFKITKPREIKPQNMVDSNVLVNDYPEYDVGTEYSRGDRCITAATRQVWESVADANQGNNPLDNPDKWLSPGLINRWLAFDAIIDSRTVTTDAAAPYKITYQLRPMGAVTHIHFMNVIGCSSINVKLVDPTAGEAYNETANMTVPPESASWWAWSFGGRKASTLADFKDIPAYINGDIFIEMIGGESLGVGSIILGREREFGVGVQLGARVKMQSHSVKTRDEFGQLILKRRIPSKGMGINLVIDNTEVDALTEFLAEIDAVPCLFSASDKYNSLKVFGVVQNSDTLIQYNNLSVVDLDIEGMQ